MYLTFGKQHIFYDKLIFNYGLRLGYTAGMALVFDASDGSFNGSSKFVLC